MSGRVSFYEGFSSQRILSARFIASNPCFVLTVMVFSKKGTSKPRKISVWLKSVVPFPSSCSAKQCSPSKIPGSKRCPSQRNSFPSAKRMICGWNVIACPPGGSMRALIFSPRRGIPAIDRINGFQDGYAEKSMSAAQIFSGDAWMVAHVSSIFICF